MRQAAQNHESPENTDSAAALPQVIPVPHSEPSQRRLLRLGLGILWFSAVTVSVLILRLAIAGPQKLTLNGVTTLQYRLGNVCSGLIWGIATSVVLWLISGRYLIARLGTHDAVPQKCANSIAMYVMVLCGIFIFVAAHVVFSARLDADSFETRSLLTKRQIRFDYVSKLTVVDIHTRDRKGRDQVRFRADFHRTDGQSEEWEASTIFLIETELSDILQKRSIPFIGQGITAPHVVREVSAAEKAAAFEKYMQPIVEQQHESLRGTRWGWSVGKEREFETTFEFSSEKTLTIDVQVPYLNRSPAKYSATYERTGKQYCFRFEDGTTLEVPLEILGGEGFMFGKPVVTGGGSAAAAKEEFTHFYGRQP
ncbi:MAG: hypothetical protein NTZ32_18870 [Planctomycetales bacterium]|nr:hypothetical protein [Planctomycetales bacterium]